MIISVGSSMKGSIRAVEKSGFISMSESFYAAPALYGGAVKGFAADVSRS